MVHSFWSLVVCIKPACLPEVELHMCALRLSHSGTMRTQWVDMSRVTKTANYYYYLLFIIAHVAVFHLRTKVHIVYRLTRLYDNGHIPKKKKKKKKKKKRGEITASIKI